MSRRVRQAVRPGVDMLVDGSPGAISPPAGRLGLLTNYGARAVDGRSSAETLRRAGFRITQLLSPEHGLEASAPAGAAIPHSSLEDVPLWSLYGADMEPAEEAFDEIDGLIIDLPDVGCRYYTYTWTMREALKIASRHHTPAWVLDRPNPLGGTAIEGDVPQAGFDSPVCPLHTPVRHGLTLGEIALWQRHELRLDIDLQVVTTSGWRREMLWWETGLTWTPPSPALRTPQAAFLYPGTCLLEGTNLSEGRGTPAPFEMLGAPFIDGPSLAARLRAAPALAGVRVSALRFTPSSGKWAGQSCSGVRLELDDAHRFRPLLAGLEVLAAVAEAPEFSFRPDHFDALAGTLAWRAALQARVPPSAIAAAWETGEQWFRERRREVLLYQ